MWNEFKQDLEDETMTQEKFNEMMNNYLADLKSKDANNWGEEWEDALKWNEEHKLIQGNELGQDMYQSFLTRQAAIMMFYRFDKEGK